MNRQISFLLLASLFASSTMLAAQEEKPAEKPAAEAGSDLTAAQAKAVLEAAGFKVSVTGLALPAEADFAKQVRDLQTVRKTFLSVEKELAVAEAELDQVEAQITALKAKDVELNAAIAGANLSVEQFNRLVGALKAIEGQLDLGVQQKAKSTDKVKTTRAKANESREAYVERLLAMRTEAEKVQGLWSKAASEAKNQAALDKVNEVLKKGLTFKPTPVFTAAERQLASYEEKVLSENIKLRDDGDQLWASVVVNGKHTKEFVVSSGSAYIGIPFPIAKEMGLEPVGSDERIQLVLADGREIPGFLKKAGSIRVGKFTVEDVEVVVLDEVAVAANPVLGMSFLGNFKFEVDKARGVLKMVKIDAEAQGAPKKDNKK